MAEISADVADERTLNRFAALLDCPPSELFPDKILPPLAHWLYFLPTASQSGLGDDGHPKRADQCATSLPRRMWAGSRITFHSSIDVDSEITRHSTVLRESVKEARSGKIVIVTLAHQIFDKRGELCIYEEQDIVYREAATPLAAAAPKSLSTDAMPAVEMIDTIVPDTRLLFRYSALTFNAHRIHYDRPYAMESEGYPDLVVHGPLTATLLLYAAIGKAPSHIRQFNFRAMAPVYAGRLVRFARLSGGEDQKLAAYGEDSRVAVEAELRVSSQSPR